MCEGRKRVVRFFGGALVLVMAVEMTSAKQRLSTHAELASSPKRRVFASDRA